MLDQCDAGDGVKDGLIGDPHRCKFDPVSLLCKGASSDDCLTQGEVDTVKIVFGDIKTKKGEVIWTGFEPGSELQVNSLRSVPATPTGGAGTAFAFSAIRTPITIGTSSIWIPMWRWPTKRASTP